MTWTELAVAFLATWQIVEIWHHGDIFASWRARIEMWDETPSIRQLLRCPFCLSQWVGLAASLVLLAGAREHWLLGVPLYGLAAARLANLGNDLTHSWCRTPRNVLPLLPPEGGSGTGAGPGRQPTSDLEGGTLP
jgi:hypothetical protein